MTSPPSLSSEQLEELSLILQQRFRLNIDTSTQLAEERWRFLHGLLTKRIVWMIDHSFERLMQILYFVDLNEEEVSRLFSTAPPSDVPEALASMILKRQWQKLQTRATYHFPPE